MRPEAVIFDFDGVVVDSISTHLMAWQLAAQELFQQKIDDEMMKPLMGKATRNIAEFLCQKLNVTDRVNDLVKVKSTKVVQLRDHIPLRPGVRAYMEKLKGAKISFGIASNAPRDFVRGVSTHHQLPVEIVLGVEDADRPKPAPDLFLKCAQLLKVPVTEHKRVLVFEDSTHGLEAAKKAGMTPVGVTSMHEGDILRAAGAQQLTLDFSNFLSEI